MKNTRWLAIALLAFAFTAGPLSASENAPSQSGIQQRDANGDLSIRNSGNQQKTANVRLLVEVPGSRLRFRNRIEVAEGSTVSQVLESAYEVKHGIVCCDSRDIWSVNGLAVDPYKQKWWIIKVNGNAQNSSSTTKVSDGDLVELVYMENAFYPVAHVRLEDWVDAKTKNRRII